MMEKHKSRYLESLLRRENQNIDLYISVIKGLEKQAQSYYPEYPFTYETNFIEMLVIDGCFIIELIRKFNRKEPSCNNDPIFQMDWIMNSLQRDLILLENQIPFFVLCKLFDLIESPNQHNRLKDLILFFFHNLYPGSVQEKEMYRDLGEIKHLLDLIHDIWRPSFGDYVQIEVDSVRIERESHFIHSASEMTSAGVSFSKRESNTLFEVGFEKGVMVMPQLIIEDRTEWFFRNLIAYEQYSLDNRPHFVTDYIRLIGCLINTSRDVEILSKCGIINNRLGKNEVVSGIFNQLTDSVTGLGKGFMYSGIVSRINKHYRKPWIQDWYRAIAVLKREYFYNRWAYITFFSAVLLLLLTVAQTVCSMLQVV